MSDASLRHEYDERVAIMDDAGDIEHPSVEAALSMGLVRIAVCGGRTYGSTKGTRKHFAQVMQRVREAHPRMVVVHGGAKGADELAERWASHYGVPSDPFPADWDRFGKSAGPQRNRRMARSQLLELVTFPGGAGTRDMTQQCLQHDVPVHRV